ncbi:glycosyltransferase family 4 protein [Candidatus Saccharibacteria bacterium]|nr:glycosyltransferase family 4 protein [Candidatus Saccharibacteria bacterium]
MKIATIVRGYIPAPRPESMIYAPIDLAVAITEQLVQRGHTVDYYGPIGTHLRASSVVTLNQRARVKDYDEFEAMLGDSEALAHNAPGLWDSIFVREMFERASRGEYDLLHFHHFEMALPFVHQYPDVKVAYTLHDPISPWMREMLETYQTPNQYFISISENQRQSAPDLPYAATVYNGIDLDRFTYSEEAHDEYLLFAGRIVPEKGVKEAIQVAQMTDRQLYIIGRVPPEHQGYFEQHIRPQLNEKILFLGFVAQEQVVRYYQKAKAFMMPVQWEEPFGLAMAEAMACGTPVLALRRGSVPEVVEHGKTGFVVDTLSDMAAAVDRLDTIRPEDCHRHVVERFSAAIMADHYEAVFASIIEGTATAAQDKTALRPGQAARRLIQRVRGVGGILRRY